MNTRMPPTSSSFGRKRLITICDDTPGRCDGGFRLMNSRPLLTDAFQPDAPTDDPT